MDFAIIVKELNTSINFAQKTIYPVLDLRILTENYRLT